MRVKEKNIKENNMIKGTFEHEGSTIKVIGTSTKGYRYTLESTQDEEEQKESLLGLIVDFSYSMSSAGRATPTINAIEKLCEKFLDEQKEILLIFFGRTGYGFIVNILNYKEEIARVLKGYGQIYRFIEHPFDPQATRPDMAFMELKKYVSEKKYDTLHIIFITDGEFNGFTRIGNRAAYKKIWTTLPVELAKDIETINIHAIGLEDDYIENIKDMKAGFEMGMRGESMFTYTTVSKVEEIEKKVLQVGESICLYTIPEQIIGEHKLRIKTPYYTRDKLYTETVPLMALVEMKGITKEWMEEVVALELEIGLKTVELGKRVDKISKLSMEEQKKEYRKIFEILVPYHSEILKRNLELGHKIKSLRSRSISEWKSLYRCFEQFKDLYRDIQELISDELSEKMAFEKATRIGLKKRHIRTLARRRATNKKKQKTIVKPTNAKIEVEDDILKLSLHLGSKIIEKEMEGDIELLNERYTCFYTQADWSEIYENTSMLCVLIKYNWKDGDDWSPSRAYVEHVSTIGLVTIEGYDEVQRMIGGTEPEHIRLYGKEAKYLRVAHDETNAILPIAIDPFFMVKSYQVKERLGHMIVGSNLGYSSRHILLYIAVIKRCFNQLHETETEKMKQTIHILLNTFKLLFGRNSTVFEKDQTPLTMIDIIYNISIGNTAPYLFNSTWECATYMMIAREQDIIDAQYKYNEGHETKTLEEYRFIVWKMILRYMLILNSNGQTTHIESWKNPETWKLETGEAIKQKVMARGNDIIKEIMMDEKKVSIMPELIKKDIKRRRESRMIKIFMEVLDYSDKYNDEVWERYNRSFIPTAYTFEQKRDIKSMFTHEVIDEVIYWTLWEVEIYGQKTCYPCRKPIEIIPHIVNEVNSEYSEELKEILADIREIEEYRERRYETRYLPVSFTPMMRNIINEIFGQVYRKELSEEIFKDKLRTLFDQRITKYIDDAQIKDDIDVLANLYKYCLNTNHTITIKTESTLPFSCPANPCSPYFLQYMSDLEFSRYYKPLGFGWCNKKYRDWVDDLHPFMVQNIGSCDTVEEFRDRVIAHVQTYKDTGGSRNYEHYKDEVTAFYMMHK